MTPVPPPATQSPVDVATVRFTVGLLADFFACNGNKTLASGLREAAALVVLPPQQQDEAAPVREWGVRRYWTNREPSVSSAGEWTRENVEEMARLPIWSQALVRREAVSRTPGGVWEPVEQEGEETAAMVEPVSVGVIVSSDLVERLRAANTAWLDTVGPKVDGRTKFAAMDARADVVRELLNAVLLGATVTAPDRFSVAEIEAAFDKLPRDHNEIRGAIEHHLIAALRAGREES